jgi:hypothetical protein
MCPAFVSKCGFEAMELISEYIWFEARCLLIINKCRPVIFCILNWFQTFLSSTILFFQKKYLVLHLLLRLLSLLLFLSLVIIYIFHDRLGWFGLPP